MISRTAAATFPDRSGNEKIDPAALQKRGKIVPSQDRRRNTMNSMNASYFIEKVGHGILNAFLLAALPTALVALLVQSL
jgi:hypothetical protein